MNGFDRSLMKMAMDDILYANSSRRMKEAKTDEEKAAIVQDFAEQLRLEKLRSKLQRNRVEESSAIAANTTRPITTSSNQAVGTISTTTAPISPPKTMPMYSMKGNPTTWTNQFETRADSMRNNVGNETRRPPITRAVSIEANSTVMKRRYSEGGDVLPSSGLTGISPNTTSGLNRALNVNAIPFVPNTKEFNSTVQPSRLSRQISESSFRRVDNSTVSVRGNAAVAPKAGPIFANSPQMTSSPIEEKSIRIRPRSSSVGGSEQSRRVSSSQYEESPIKTDDSLNLIVHYQKSKLSSMALENNSCQRLIRVDALPRRLFQSDDTTQNHNEQRGMIKSGAGNLMMKKEDWDSEYEQSQQRGTKEENYTMSRPNRKNNFNTSSVNSGQKDWLSVLKEREDMAKRRYSREKMLQLTSSQASKIRPSHLSPEYNNSVGLWSPDLWFSINFPTGQPIQKRNPFNTACPATSVVDGKCQLQPEPINMRRITMLSAFYENMANKTPDAVE